MFFFFFKQKTAYEMRISNWSSDVCSSDLQRRQLGGRRRLQHRLGHAAEDRGRIDLLERLAAAGVGADLADEQHERDRVLLRREIGRASCRGRVCQYV